MAKKVRPVKMTFKMLVEQLKFLLFLFKFIFRYYYVVLNSNSIARWDHSLPLWGLFLIGKNTGRSLCGHRCFLLIRSLSKPRMTTRSEQFSYLSCLHTTIFILLSIFSLVETISLKIWPGRHQCPGMQSVHFQFPSVTQKLRLLKLSYNKTRTFIIENHDWNCSA